MMEMALVEKSHGMYLFVCLFVYLFVFVILRLYLKWPYNLCRLIDQQNEYELIYLNYTVMNFTIFSLPLMLVISFLFFFLSPVILFCYCYITVALYLTSFDCYYTSANRYIYSLTKSVAIVFISSIHAGEISITLMKISSKTCHTIITGKSFFIITFTYCTKRKRSIPNNLKNFQCNTVH